jgi:drug efflux transport system permease protein
MRWNRLSAMARKEMLQIRRDTRSVLIVVAMPLVLMLLFGYGVSLDVKHVPVYVFDREGSQRSQDLLKRFQASEYFDVRGGVDNYPALVAAINSGRARLGLVIPPDFTERLNGGETVGVQAVVDATDDNTANLIFGYAEAVIQGYSQSVQLAWLDRQGLPRGEVPLALEPRTWFNENLESRVFIVPGVVALVMAVIGTFLTSLTIAREWERGTMEQLISTPVKPLEVMLGKLAPYFVIGMLDAALCVALGVWWFQVPFRGKVSALLAGSALFLVAVLAMGYVISVAAKSQLAASQLALVSTFLPAFLLSGFLFAIAQMPAFIRAVTYVIPARYYVSLLKMVFLKGTPVAQMGGELAALGIFALALGAAATRAFRKKLG